MEQQSALKTGKRPTQLVNKTFKPSDVLFEEGSTGREVFMVSEGRVGVFKNTPDGEIELAVIGKGSMVGEMSLLDNLPRSATVRALDETKVLVINQLMFTEALQQVPVWLTSIIKIIVSRLRDANKRVDQAILRDKERGVVSLLLLLFPSCKYEFGGGVALDYDMMLVEAYFICRLKKKEIVKYLESISKRAIIGIEEDSNHKKHILIKDIEVLRLFEEFLILKSQKKTFRESAIPDAAIATLSNIAYVAQKSGRETEDGTQLSQQVFIADVGLTDARKNEAIEKDLMELRRRGVINTMPSNNNDTVIIFKNEMISRIKKIKEWLPRFGMDIE